MPNLRQNAWGASFLASAPTGSLSIRAGCQGHMLKRWHAMSWDENDSLQYEGLDLFTTGILRALKAPRSLLWKIQADKII